MIIVLVIYQELYLLIFLLNIVILNAMCVIKSSIQIIKAPVLNAGPASELGTRGMPCEVASTLTITLYLMSSPVNSENKEFCLVFLIFIVSLYPPLKASQYHCAGCGPNASQEPLLRPFGPTMRLAGLSCKCCQNALFVAHLVEVRLTQARGLLGHVVDFRGGWRVNEPNSGLIYPNSNVHVLKSTQLRLPRYKGKTDA